MWSHEQEESFRLSLHTRDFMRDQSTALHGVSHKGPEDGGQAMIKRENMIGFRPRTPQRQPPPFVAHPAHPGNLACRSQRILAEKAHYIGPLVGSDVKKKHVCFKGKSFELTLRIGNAKYGQMKIRCCSFLRNVCFFDSHAKSAFFDACPLHLPCTDKSCASVRGTMLER